MDLGHDRRNARHGRGDGARIPVTVMAVSLLALLHGCTTDWGPYLPHDAAAVEDAGGDCANLLVNPSFASGLDNWGTYNAEQPVATPALPDAHTPDGHVVLLVAKPSTPGGTVTDSGWDLSQSGIVLPAGATRTYVARAWVRLDPANTVAPESIPVVADLRERERYHQGNPVVLDASWQLVTTEATLAGGTEVQFLIGRTASGPANGRIQIADPSLCTR